MIEGVVLTPLKIIEVKEGDVLHAMKCGDPGFSGFGEAYFSKIEPGSIKAWKRHQKMVLNLIVPIGEILLVLFDDRNKKKKITNEFVLSPANYSRLTVPPMIWMGFMGLSCETSILLNIASVEHDPKEADKKNLKDIDYNWNKI